MLLLVSCHFKPTVSNRQSEVQPLRSPLLTSRRCRSDCSTTRASRVAAPSSNWATVGSEHGSMTGTVRSSACTVPCTRCSWTQCRQICIPSRVPSEVRTGLIGSCSSSSFRRCSSRRRCATHNRSSGTRPAHQWPTQTSRSLRRAGCSDHDWSGRRFPRPLSVALDFPLW